MNLKQEIAVVMAAGKGERLRPITLETPKPLVKVHGVPMIETVLRGLLYRGVKKIYVVIGYLREQFDYLPEKYPEVELVENWEYDCKNNIASMYAAAHLLGKSDCIFCDGDLYISDPSVFQVDFSSSFVFGKMHLGKTSEWVYRMTDGRVTDLGPGGENEYTMGGITFLKQKDAAVLAEAVIEAYAHKENEQLFWDTILQRNLDKIVLTVHPVTEEQVVEIDSVSELEVVDPTYLKGNHF